jgi:hypothetical protein
MQRVPTPCLNNFPLIILWAWERPEDLSFLDPEQVAVALLATELRAKLPDTMPLFSLVVFKRALD